MANMMSVYETYGNPEIEKMRQAFVNMLNDYCKKEKQDCRRAKVRVQPNMVGDNRRAVIRLVGECDTPWKIESLRRLVFFYNQIPDRKRIFVYAEALRAEALAGTNVKRPKARTFSVPITFGNYTTSRSINAAGGFVSPGGVIIPTGVSI